jgi:hypothetical protein
MFEPVPVKTFVRATVPPQKERIEIKLNLALDEDNAIFLYGPRTVEYGVRDCPSDSAFPPNEGLKKSRFYFSFGIPRQDMIVLTIPPGQDSKVIRFRVSYLYYPVPEGFALITMVDIKMSHITNIISTGRVDDQADPLESYGRSVFFSIGTGPITMENGEGQPSDKNLAEGEDE